MHKKSGLTSPDYFIVRRNLPHHNAPAFRRAEVVVHVPKYRPGVRKLYLPPRRQHFWSRTAHELIYGSQQESFPDRAARRAHKIRRRLGGNPEAIRYPRKPPRMRQVTYDRLLDKLAAAENVVEDAANERFLAAAAKLIGW
jgi:hypothetical protein